MVRPEATPETAFAELPEWTEPWPGSEWVGRSTPELDFTTTRPTAGSAPS